MVIRHFPYSLLCPTVCWRVARDIRPHQLHVVSDFFQSQFYGEFGLHALFATNARHKSVVDPGCVFDAYQSIFRVRYMTVAMARNSPIEPMRSA